MLKCSLMKSFGMGSDDVLPIYLAELDTQEEKDYFEKLYRQYKRKMYAIAYDILNNDADAEDAVDIAFHKVAKSLTKISQKPSNEIDGYIVICIRSTAIDIYRSNHRKSERTRPLKEDDPDEEVWEHTVDRVLLISAISKLPDNYKDVIYLCDYQKLTSNEAAALLKTTESNVRITLHRVHKKLRKILEEGEDDND